MVNIWNPISIWYDLWVTFLGDNAYLDIRIPRADGSYFTYSWNYFYFSYYLILVWLCVYFGTLAIHLFVDIWEVKQ